MRVYRVENKNGEGFYTARNLPKEVYDLTNGHYDDAHLGPCQEGWGYVKPGCRFGFKTREQLDKWLTPNERKILGKNGFRIAVYHTKRLVKSSKYQCIFYKEKSRRVTAFSLSRKGKK